MQRRLRTIIREPLLHFLIIGAALFVLSWATSDPTAPPQGSAGTQSNRIVIRAGEIEQLAVAFEKTWQRPPAESELEALVEGRVRDEIYYREALAMGLDRDDAIIRRRLRQKLEFLTEDVAELEPPGDAELQAFLDANPERFFREAQMAFQQVYINSERRGIDAKSRAEAALRALRKGDDPAPWSDPLMVPDAMPLSRESETSRVFGETFAQAVLDLEPGAWQGPVRSGYGLHLVRVIKRKPGSLPALSEIRDRVEREWLVQRKKVVQDRIYQGLRDGYTVVVEKLAPVEKPEVAAKRADDTSEKVQ